MDPLATWLICSSESGSPFNLRTPGLGSTFMLTIVRGWARLGQTERPLKKTKQLATGCGMPAQTVTRHLAAIRRK
jgi:hypothetical protein